MSFGSNGPSRSSTSGTVVSSSQLADRRLVDGRPAGRAGSRDRRAPRAPDRRVRVGVQDHDPRRDDQDRLQRAERGAEDLVCHLAQATCRDLRQDLRREQVEHDEQPAERHRVADHLRVLRGDLREELGDERPDRASAGTRPATNETTEERSRPATRRTKPLRNPPNTDAADESLGAAGRATPQTIRDGQPLRVRSVSSASLTSNFVRSR